MGERRKQDADKMPIYRQIAMASLLLKIWFKHSTQWGRTEQTSQLCFNSTVAKIELNAISTLITHVLPRLLTTSAYYLFFWPKLICFTFLGGKNWYQLGFNEGYVRPGVV
jgi:hypothetical protein